MKESELYEPIKTLLTTKGYEVYAEVLPRIRGLYDARADVIAFDGDQSIIVEMKTSLSMDLIEQAYRWLPHCNRVYIAIPTRKKGIPSFTRDVLKHLDIGVIEVNDYGRASITHEARYRYPDHIPDWSTILLPEHQTWLEGGSSGGGYVTDYSLTIDRVRQYMLTSPEKWWTTSDILKGCLTHYSNPKQSLGKALKEFEKDWCEHKLSRGKLHFRVRRGWNEK